MATIKSVSTLIVDGDWIESKDQSPEGIRLVQTGNIGIGTYLDKPNRAKYISVETFERLNCTELNIGDILVSRLPDPIGRACRVPDNIGRAITAVDCTIIRLNPDKCDAEYFVQYTQSELYQNRLSQFFAGSTRTRISRKNLEQIEIPLPNITEQKRIASTLGKVDKLIALRKEQLVKLDQLVKSRFIELFGDPKANNKAWKMNTFADICAVRQGLQIPISKRLTICEENCYEYITVAYLHGSKEREYIKNPKSTVICTKEDILMTRTGNTGMVVTNVAGVFHNNFFLVDFDRTRYNKRFLVEYLNLDLIQTEIKRRAGTSTIPDLNHGEFYAILIYEPPITLQEQFAAFVEQNDKSKLAIQQIIDKLELLKKSLMQEYFG